MAIVSDLASQLASEILTVVPWWAWAALLVMILWGPLVPEREDQTTGPRS